MDHSNYIIPFGKYKFTALCRVPANYLLGLYGDKTKMEKYPEINAYIEANLTALIPKQAIKVHIVEPIAICDKQPYTDEEEAKKALKLIRQDKREHKKPIRAYKCEKCRFWHLTSKPNN